MSLELADGKTLDQVKTDVDANTTSLADLEIIQVVTAEDSAVLSSGGANIPYDDTKPQSSEGAAAGAYDLVITPKDAGSTLLFIGTFNASVVGGTGFNLIIAAFKDAEADARAVGWKDDSGGNGGSISLHFSAPAVAASSQTWKIRFGGSSGTMVLNGNNSGTRLFDTTIKSGWTVFEIAP